MSDILPHSAVKKLLKVFGSKDGSPNCKIFHARLCSCVGGNNGVFDPTCPACIYGWIYAEPIEELVIRTAMNLRAMNDKMVHIYTGGAKITIPYKGVNDQIVEAHSKISQADVITMNGDEHRDRDICEIGKRDYLIAFSVTKVLIVSERAKIFTLDEDYKVHYTDARTSIEWVGSNRPRQFYAVEYLCNINYMVWDDSIKMRGAVDSPLPRNVYCRLRPNYDPEVNKSMNVKTMTENINDVITNEE